MLPPLLILLLTFGRFIAAADLDRDIEGNFYVVDRGANMLVKYSPRGDSLRSVSGYGNGSLQFDGPVAVYARRGNDLFVADYNNHRVQRFDRTLDYITTIYSRDDPDPRKRFGYPRDVTVTRQGDILIVDGENRRVIKFDLFGKVQNTFGDINAGAGRLIEPSQIDVDSDDNVYVLDGGRVLQFDPFGGYVRDVVLPQSGGIRSISLDRDTLVAVDSSEVTLYDIRTRSIVMSYGLAAPAAAVRYIGDRFFAVEAHRIGAYTLDSTGVIPAGIREH